MRGAHGRSEGWTKVLAIKTPGSWATSLPNSVLHEMLKYGKMLKENYLSYVFIIVSNVLTEEKKGEGRKGLVWLTVLGITVYHGE